MIDVDNCDSDLLPYIAALVGWKINKELPIPRQRAEIKSAVYMYKRKGTVLSIERLIEVVTGVQATVDEYFNNVVTTNIAGQGTVDIFNPVTASNIGLPNDTISYTIEPQSWRTYCWDVYGIFILGDNVHPFTEITLKKVNRVIGEFNPINAIPKLGYVDIIREEFYEKDLSANDSSIAEVTSLNSEQYSQSLKILHTNAFAETTNSDYLTWFPLLAENRDDVVESLNVEPYRGYAGSFLTNTFTHITNSLSYTTAGFWLVEDYEDLIINLDETMDEENLSNIEFALITNDSEKLINDNRFITVGRLGDEYNDTVILL